MNSYLRFVAVLCFLAINLPQQAHAQVAAPGGLHLGFYLEDPITNPEDPMPGSFYLRLPIGDSQYSGAMSFTFIGCQTQNVGNVSGTKSGAQLSGIWSGSIDGTPQSGTYAAEYDPLKAMYLGTYTNDKGKQYIDLWPCIAYAIAPNGEIGLFRPGTRAPANFLSGVGPNLIYWAPRPRTNVYLVSIYDLEKVRNDEIGAIVYQKIMDGRARCMLKSLASLEPGKTYLYAVVAFDIQRNLLGHTSGQFKMP